MKKLVLLISLVLGAVLITPKFIGGMIETEYAKALQSMNTNPSIEITNSHFDRRWFSGESTAEIKFKGIPNIEKVSIIATEAIHFGPVIFSDDGIHFALATSRIDFTIKGLPEDEELDELLANLKSATTVTSEVTYGLDYITKLTIDEVTYSQGDENLVSRPVNGEITFADEKKYVGFIQWGGLSLNTSKESVDIQPITMTFDQQAIAGDIYSGSALFIGDFKLLFEKINTRKNDGSDLFSIDNLSLSADIKENNKLLDVAVNYHADEINANQLSFKNANLDLGVNGLDQDVLIELNQYLQQAQMITDPNELKTAYQQAMSIAVKLLAKNPTFKINDLSVETPEGALQISGFMQVNHDLFDVNNPMSLIGAVNATAQGHGPEAFFTTMGVAPVLDMYVQQGFLTRDNTQLSFDAKFSQGQLTLNGHVVPL